MNTAHASATEASTPRWRNVLLALALLVPAPSLGALAAMHLFPNTALGAGLFAASKLWLFVFPAAWAALVDRQRLRFSLRSGGGLAAGLGSGLLLGLLIWLAFALFGHGLIDRPLFSAKMREIGLGTWPAYVGGAAYWILVNSVLEEYVWRWFVYKKCEALFAPRIAIALSALFFTLHHFVALRTYFSLALTIIASLGVFVGGTSWSLLYARYRSVWPGYLSHAVIDLVIFGLGAHLLFGGTP